MTPDLLAVLQHWPATRHGADVRRVENRHSFSGAEIWRVAADGREFALRAWPESVDADRLREIHVFQSQLCAHGISAIPEPQATPIGDRWTALDDRLWELCSWVPGEPDCSLQPSTERMQAACRKLAQIHLAFSRNGRGKTHAAEPVDVVELMFANDLSPAMHLRAERLGSIANQIAAVGEMIRRWAGERSATDAATRVLALVAETAPAEQKRAERGLLLRLPLQPRLGDARREHFLFTGDEVTGVVDFGAVDVDSPAGDVARLLGGFAGDDRERWAIGLAAYEEVHPLTGDERTAVDLFDSTGTVIAAFNWVRWLFDKRHALAPTVDRQAALERLAQLTARLRTLADRTNKGVVLED